MKNISRIIWGIMLIAVGAIFALNALNVTDIDVFFDGWWTLFIIVPCAINLFVEREKTGNLIGLIVGVLLLLACRDVFSFSLLWKLLVPAVIILIGLRLLIGGVFRSKSAELLKKLESEGRKPKVTCAVFSGSDIRYDGEVFDGADLTAVFGGIQCDLRRAVIDHDTVIRVSAVFGGVDVLVPDGVNVKTSVTGIFGGTDNKTIKRDGAPTIYVSGICVFGGAEIK